MILEQIYNFDYWNCSRHLYLENEILPVNSNDNYLSYITVSEIALYSTTVEFNRQIKFEASAVLCNIKEWSRK